MKIPNKHSLLNDYQTPPKALHGLEVIFLDTRINFENPDNGKSGSWFATAWFTWGLNIGKEMTFETY